MGVGVAAEWVGDGGPRIFREAADFVSELDFDGDTPVLLGGFAFRSAAAAPSFGGLPADSNHGSIWSGFPSGRLVLPEVLLSFPFDADEKAEKGNPVEVVLAGGKSEELLAQLLSEAREFSQAAMDSFAPADPATPSSPDQESAGHEPKSLSQADSEAAADYRGLLQEAVEAIGSGELEKVVAARQVRHGCCPAPEDVLRRLRERDGGSTVFAFGSGGGAGSRAADSVFAGASPELLAAKSEGCFASLALAGSKPLREADLLLGDPKELLEHQYVVDHLRNRLAKIDAELAPTGTPELLCLANIAHLASRVSGKTSAGILALMEALHPSPAVAGVPTDAALEFLDQREQFDRGWYAGPVGWLTPNGDGRFFVALRSVLLNPDECFLFAGSGIVDGSCPEKEEQETWLKLQTAMEALLPSSLANPTSPPNPTSPASSPSPANPTSLAV